MKIVNSGTKTMHMQTRKCCKSTRHRAIFFLHQYQTKTTAISKTIYFYNTSILYYFYGDVLPKICLNVQQIHIWHDGNENSIWHLFIMIAPGYLMSIFYRRLACLGRNVCIDDSMTHKKKKKKKKKKNGQCFAIHIFYRGRFPNYVRMKVVEN